MTDKVAADIARWWAQRPMTYGTRHGGTEFGDGPTQLGSAEQLAASDEVLLGWNSPLHSERPFDQIFPYSRYVGDRVLEVGCGLGFMTEQWVRSGAKVTAIDLSETAVAITKARLTSRSSMAEVLRADARALPFEDASFDYVYSWGVLHHSPNFAESIAEIARVSRPGAGLGVMVYNRRSLLWLYEVLYNEGFLHGESRHLTRLELGARYGDGAREGGNPFTWPMTVPEVKRNLDPHFTHVETRVLGTDLDFVLRHLVPPFGHRLPLSLRKSLARRWGWSIWASGTRR